MQVIECKRNILIRFANDTDYRSNQMSGSRLQPAGMPDLLLTYGRQANRLSFVVSREVAERYGLVSPVRKISDESTNRVATVEVGRADPVAPTTKVVPKRTTVARQKPAEKCASDLRDVAKRKQSSSKPGKKPSGKSATKAGAPNSRLHKQPKRKVGR